MLIVPPSIGLDETVKLKISSGTSFSQPKIINKETDKEIYKYLTERYGDWILFDPPLKKKTLLLWALPLITLIGGFFILGKRLVFHLKQ